VNYSELNALRELNLDPAAEAEIAVPDAPIRVTACRRCFLCGMRGAEIYAGVSDWLFGVSGDWRFRACSDCGTAWLDPQPAEQDIPKLYAKYYTHNVAPSHTTFENLRREIASSVLSDLGYRVKAAKKLLPLLLSKVPPIHRANALDVFGLAASDEGRLLDVGCGDGLFIGRMRSLGWTASGVDPDPSAVAFGRSHGLEIFCGTIDDVPGESRYDVITLSHVIEHVADPVDLLRKCAQRLELGGRLLITTPNVESLGHRWFKRYWRGFEVPRHLKLLSARSLRECVSRAGLRVRFLSSETRMAVRIHNASSCARQGEHNVAERTRFKTSTKIGGYGFMLSENILIYLNRDLGEELFCECGAPEGKRDSRAPLVVPPSK
jgi:2-polyprenyl-3-methyl-5-hydroxy-6-metoxy-1,4-benzoquinol methylase